MGAQELRTPSHRSTVSTMNHTQWFERVTRGDSLRRVAEVADISDRTLSRQLREGELRPDMIIRIAEGYDESPVIALVDLGFISARWITETGIVTSLSRATDEELTDELLRRLRLLDDTPVDQLAERRAKKSNTAGGDVRPVWDGVGMPPDAVADTSPEVGGSPDDLDP